MPATPTPESTFTALEPLLEEYAQVEAQMSDPAVLSDSGMLRKVGRRFAELSRVKSTYDRYCAALADLNAAEELVAEDESFAEELPELREAADKAKAAIIDVLAPRDPDDALDVILEVKAGEGGEESALFASDLARMYARYAATQGWTVTELSATHTELGGYKDITLAIRAKGTPTPEEGVWAHLKYEGGVHRVQRIPVTESQGRIHTSAVGVFVMPEVEDDEEIQIDPHDLRIDVFRSSGPGGQSVNTTDSAVRITHIPSGIVVSMQNEKSQLQNKEAALRVLASRLAAEARAKREAENSAQRLSQVRTVDRSERIRTYNFPENRIADHRTGFKAHNLDHVLEGALGPVIASAIEADEAARLQQDHVQ
ncbi:MULTISPECIES: peptide chain release factor 1 [unclassified Schaalia]|uniref:peptide chain release factor 1 n=1 Tax=unclassified Schaalia TaxID=2691889 RepID=UPI001E57EE9C|nr:MULTISPECIES: peptide chain release factor 1 [unclassified Schaalia]MCD4549654.1 peptide chain release factor 1 [Schaalia sp. lx-260]MCD4556717.1 peptide chain release factor 1 [Schaalia sp. lx-100]